MGELKAPPVLYSYVQSSACQYSTAIEITQASSDAMFYTVSQHTTSTTGVQYLVVLAWEGVLCEKSNTRDGSTYMYVYSVLLYLVLHWSLDYTPRVRLRA